MNSHEIATLRGLITQADACFDDLKRLGAISRPNAIDYRKFREQARQIIAAHDAEPYVHCSPEVAAAFGLDKLATVPKLRTREAMLNHLATCDLAGHPTQRRD